MTDPRSPAATLVWTTTFRQRAGQQQFKQRTSATHVSVESDRIVGFVTVVAGVIRREDLSGVQRGLPPSALPVLVLARMGVDVGSQGLGIGAALLGRVLSIASSMALECGCVGILVDAKAGAVGFYEKYDFQWLLPPAPDGTRRRFLSIRTIEAGVAPQ